MTLTELAIKRPSLVVVIFTVLGVLGIGSFLQLKYELLPKMDQPMVTISTIYPGASPSEVETSVTKIVEDAISGLENVKTVRSTSQEGFSFVMVEFSQAAKIDVVLQDAQRKVGEIANTLPQDAKAPILSKFALDELPVLRMGLTSAMPAKEFSQFLKDRVIPRIQKVQGVAQVYVGGNDEREIKVNIDAAKLRSYGLSIMQVSGAIQASNLDFPTGKIKDADGQYIVRVAGKIGSIDELRGLIVGQSRTGGDIRLSDVAEVADGSKEMANYSRLNGVTSVGMQVVKQSDANAVDMSKMVRAEIAAMEKEYAAQKLKFDIAQDGSLFTVDAATAVQVDLLIAIGLVAIVMLLFLHSLRSSFIVMVAIPASLVSTFLAMYIFGFTLNLMTLLALSLVVGILVDDSIVVLENIYRRLELGDDKRTAALTGRNEIGFTALSITLVDVVVFLPLSLVSGIVGNIMREFAIVVVVSTLLSLFVSFTITPVLASRIGKLEHLTKKTLMGRFGLWFEAGYEAFTNWYTRALRWALGHRLVVGGLTILLLFSSFALMGMGFIGFEFITQADRGEFSVGLELPASSTLENTNQMTLRAERIISEIPEVNKVFVNVGASSEGILTQSVNNSSDIAVALVPKKQRIRSTDEVGEEIKAKLTAIPGVKVRINPIGIFGGANQTPIQMVISGTQPEEVRASADRVMQMVKAIPGTADVRLSSEDGKPETRINIDRAKMADLGLSIAEVGGTLRVALTGDDQSKFRDGVNEYDIRVQLDEFNRNSTSDVGNLTFMNRRGEQIELKQFATIVQTTGPTKLTRRDRISSITVMAQVNGRPSGSIATEFEQALAKDPLPTGISFAWDGDIKNQRESNSSMLIAFMAGILFVYLIMVALYDSYLWPFVVLFSIPLAIIGAFWALALAAKSMTIFSMLGLIMLIGLVGKNAILLVDFTNKLREEGRPTFEALVEAGRERLRPILMTTLTMIIGMLPIALSTASGAEWKAGLAWALIGGLTSSMVLTLVVVPVVYLTMDNLRRRTQNAIGWISRKTKRRPQKSDDDEMIPEPVVARTKG